MYGNAQVKRLFLIAIMPATPEITQVHINNEHTTLDSWILIFQLIVSGENGLLGNVQKSVEMESKSWQGQSKLKPCLMENHAKESHQSKKPVSLRIAQVTLYSSTILFYQLKIKWNPPCCLVLVILAHLFFSKKCMPRQKWPLPHICTLLWG